MNQPGLEPLRRIYFSRDVQWQDSAIDRQLLAGIIEQAKQVISHPSRPMVRDLETFARAPWAEIALEESLDENPTLDSAEALLVELQTERPLSCVAMLDASSSMAGEKHLLSSIAVAVFFLKAEISRTSLVLFASKAKCIKRLGAREKIESTLSNFLRHQPRGFTNIGAGLEEGLNQFRVGRGSGRRVGILVTDGRATEGKDPVLLASRYDYLAVLHLHGPGSFLESSQAIAAAGNGICLEVKSFEELPHRLYDALRSLSRR